MNSLALSSTPDFVVRPAVDESELNYVRKTWLREYADEAAPPVRLTFGPPHIYDREHKYCLEAVLERGAVTIACRPSVSSGICGFAVTEDRVVHFVYVKHRWRQLGVAKLLLRPLLDEAAIYTHRTRMLDASRLPKSWTFNPYPFLRG